MYSNKPYQETAHILVPSSHGELKGKQRYYRVSKGIAEWSKIDPENLHVVVVVFVQFGENPDFYNGKRKKEIVDHYPCHILAQDMDQVTAAMKRLGELGKRNLD